MDLLRVKNGKVVDAAGHEVRLRGTCVGGWMNMENFINGYPGSEHGIRATMSRTIGPARAHFFFERMLDHFLDRDDLAFIKQCGATAVRLPINYRHFEGDDRPFSYLEAGFTRLAKMVQLCAEQGLYAIIDLHAVQGWQNTGWHSDNANRHSLFWQHPHFQDRFVALWEELARRYSGNPAVAGYNVMNEPVTNTPDGRFPYPYQPAWGTMNQVYSRVIGAIRAIDAEHIIYLEGDNYSRLFAGLETPASDVVYSSHNYTPAGFGPGAYPGMYGNQYWDRGSYAELFSSEEGSAFSREHNVPLWVGEFGSVYNGVAAEVPDRLRAMDDQLAVLEEFGAHWTTWTYKDVGVMGWVVLDPQSDYMQLVAPILEAKRLLDADFWMRWLPMTPAKQMVQNLAHVAETTIGDPDIQVSLNHRYLSEAALAGYTAELMQPAYARLFAGMTETQLDRVLESFAFRNCRPHAGLVDVLRRHIRA